MTETPQITTSSYASNSIDLFSSLPSLDNTGGVMQAWGSVVADTVRDFRPFQRTHPNPLTNPQEITEAMANTPRRIVQVFMADPNENVPLDKAVLYKGDQKLTDLTDQELFFEIPITETLKAHNAARVTWQDKEASKRSGKDVLLDPVKIRDLKMVVVTIAQF